MFKTMEFGNSDIVSLYWCYCEIKY